MKEQESKLEIKLDISLGEYTRMHTLAEAYGAKTLEPVFGQGSSFVEWLHDSVDARQSFIRIAEKTHIGNPFFLTNEGIDVETVEEKDHKAVRLSFHATKESLIRLLKFKEQFDLEDMEDLLDLSMTCLEILLIAHRTGVSTTMQINGKPYDMYDKVRRGFQR
jgi:hypothetical protein